MNLWVVFGILSLVAVAFASWPIYKKSGRLTPLLASVIVFVVALPAGLYYYQGQPGLASASMASAEMDDEIHSLAKRLEENPDDVRGWKLLGQSYMALRNFPGAIDAFERVLELQPSPDAQTLISLGEAKFIMANGAMSSDVAIIFENALALEPSSMPALFYGGIAAKERGDSALARSRWERLLDMNVPPEIRSLIEQQMAALDDESGKPLPDGHPPLDNAEPESAPADPGPDVLVSARVSLADNAMAALQQDAVVFVIARDPAQPMPPIAVVRRMLSDLPAQVDLSDSDSMMQGRNLASYAEFELVARVAVSGERTQQSGDWTGTVLVRPAESKTVDLRISTQVP
jgi:cytochrome c-type biogenesis protein CcmH